MSIIAIKINDNLYFNSLAVTLPKSQKVAKVALPEHQVIIVDRSGSMYYCIEEMIEVIKDYCKSLPEGSTVSLGYFSGVGQYNLSVPYVVQKEISGVVSVLDTYKYTLSMTNFIEILNKVVSTCKEKASLFFFTDGAHNVGGSKAAIELALQNWALMSNVSVFVGYGSIDREMMNFMAKTANGSFVHLDHFSSFKSTLKDFGETVKELSPKVQVVFPYSSISPIISILNKQVISYKLNNLQVDFKPNKKGANALFFLTDKLLEEAILTEDVSTTLSNGMRALALICSQNNDANTALTLLNYLGDKYLVRSLFNAITPEEFAQVETAIRKSVSSPKARFIEGNVKNYLPDPNAFCVFDVIDSLISDDNVKLYVRDPEFRYERIGRKSIQTDGPRSEEVNAPVSLNNLVFHNERLNVSVSTSVPATVTLLGNTFKNKIITKEELKPYKLPEIINVTNFRTYNIISNGVVQTKKLIVSNLSKDTINKLGSVLTLRKDNKYVIDLNNLPIINKKYTKNVSARELALLTWEDYVLSSELSVYKFLKKRTEEALGLVSLKPSLYNEEAQKFLLENCYIKGDTYNPPSTLEEATDVVDVYTFSIAIKGMSKVSASAVIEKIEKGKPITDRESLVAAIYNGINKSFTGQELITYCKNHIEYINKKLLKLRKELQLAKFAVILGNRGAMPEFSDRSNMVLNLNIGAINRDYNFDFIFKIGTDQVKV